MSSTGRFLQYHQPDSKSPSPPISCTTSDIYYGPRPPNPHLLLRPPLASPIPRRQNHPRRHPRTHHSRHHLRRPTSQHPAHGMAKHLPSPRLHRSHPAHLRRRPASPSGPSAGQYPPQRLRGYHGDCIPDRFEFPPAVPRFRVRSGRDVHRGCGVVVYQSRDDFRGHVQRFGDN